MGVMTTKMPRASMYVALCSTSTPLGTALHTMHWPRNEDNCPLDDGIG